MLHVFLCLPTGQIGQKAYIKQIDVLFVKDLYFLICNSETFLRFVAIVLTPRFSGKCILEHYCHNIQLFSNIFHSLFWIFVWFLKTWKKSSPLSEIYFSFGIVILLRSVKVFVENSPKFQGMFVK